MSLTLTADIEAGARTLEVTGTVPPEVEPGYLFALDDEMFRFTTFALETVQLPSWTEEHPDPQTWIVVPAQGGTTAAAHTAGATVKAVLGALVAAADESPLPDPFAAGGGGLPTGWTQDPESGAVDTGGQGFTSQSAVIETLTATSLYATVEGDSPSADGTLSIDTGGGNISLAGGELDMGDGTFANVGDIRVEGVLNPSGTMEMDTDLNMQEYSVLDFLALVPHTVPVIPLTTPSVQNVIDALVTLGLVTQSD